MRPIKVNADYELQLFESKKAPPIVNQSLEFMAFFLTDRVIHTEKTYSEEYLRYVEIKTGRRPVTVKTGNFDCWWGPLLNIEAERKLNSKLESAKLCKLSQIVESTEDLQLLPEVTYVAKSPGGMSGQNIKRVTKETCHHLNELLKNGPLIVEPLLDRKSDFSHYVFEDNLICYENIVDVNFQYKGTIIHNVNQPDIESLPFYRELTHEKWDQFRKERELVIEHYRALGASSGYSIDSFTYRKSGELEIRTLSEVNYRRTMGLLAWQLTKLYLREANWSFFVLAKKDKNLTFSQVKMKLEGSDVLYLSPGDTRFEMFLIGGKTIEDGMANYAELKRLLPDCEFPV